MTINMLACVGACDRLCALEVMLSAQLSGKPADDAAAHSEV